MKFPPVIKWLAVTALIAGSGGGIFYWRSAGAKSQARQTAPSGSAPGATTVGTAVATPPPPAPTPAGGFPQYENFQRRPFAVTSRAGAFEWTAEDGKDLQVIRQIAHNDGEYQRLVEENNRIKRRQLVYRTETTAALIERNKLTGEPLLRLTVPGLDGQLVDVEITKAELNPSGLQGALAGRVAGQPESLVTLAFKGGREAFTVINPAAGLFLHAEPREPGELIVKSIDPDVYASGYCGNP
jgi:hypothetical protein